MARARTIKPQHCHCYNVISLDYLRSCVYTLLTYQRLSHRYRLRYYYDISDIWECKSWKWTILFLTCIVFNRLCKFLICIICKTELSSINDLVLAWHHARECVPWLKKILSQRFCARYDVTNDWFSGILATRQRWRKWRSVIWVRLLERVLYRRFQA